MRTTLATKSLSYTTPQAEQEKDRRYVLQVAAEVQKLYNNQILAGKKDDAQHSRIKGTCHVPICQVVTPPGSLPTGGGWDVTLGLLVD